MDEPLGERFARALAAKNVATTTTLLRRAVDFRALTPGHVWKATSPEQVEEVPSSWFELSDHIDQLLSVDSGQVGDRERVGYRLAVHNADGNYVVEEQAYYEATDGDITWMRVLCSGWRKVEPAQP